jgi:hypothetical protein
VIVRVLLLMSTIALGQTVGTRDAGLRRFERTLLDVVRWEILWHETPNGFHNPIAPASVAIATTPTSLSYCSHDIGVCASYQIEASRNWERIKSVKCDGHESDEEALLSFVGADANRPKLRLEARKPPVLGAGGFSGNPTADFPLRWTTTLNLGTLNSIIEQYRHLHPPEVSSLQDWLRTRLRDSGYSSVTIACFSASDPVVYVYGERASNRPIVISVFWDREQEKWAEAGMLEPPQGAETFERLKSTIQSISCGTARFD